MAKKNVSTKAAKSKKAAPVSAKRIGLTKKAAVKKVSTTAKKAVKSAKTARKVVKKAAAAVANKPAAVKKTVSAATKKKAVARKQVKAVKAAPVAKKATKAAPVKAKKAAVAKKAPKKVAASPGKPAAKKAASPKRVAPEAKARKKASPVSTGSASKAENEVRKGIPVFSMDEALGIIAERSKEKAAAQSQADAAARAAASASEAAVQNKKKSHGVASIKDILGFDPLSEDGDGEDEESKVEKKWLPFYRQLIDLRDKANEGLIARTAETLKRLSRDDSGDVSAFSQHLADAGTENFERDFALSILSSDQETLYEIEEAIKRVLNGTYGVCEITGKPIPRDRLRAVPFARYTIEGQVQLERRKRRGSSNRATTPLFQTDDETTSFAPDEESDD